MINKIYWWTGRQEFLFSKNSKKKGGGKEGEKCMLQSNFFISYKFRYKGLKSRRICIEKKICRFQSNLFIAAAGTRPYEGSNE